MNLIDPSAKVSKLSDIEQSIRGSKLVVGSGTIIDSFVKVKFAGGSGDIVIGARCTINSGCVLYSGNGISIGNDVAIAANCTLAPTNHEYEGRGLIRLQGFRPSKGGIVIEDDVWVGANCTLLDGAILRRGCVIGAGTVVNKEIRTGAVVAGNPLRVVGDRGRSHEK